MTDPYESLADSVFGGGESDPYAAAADGVWGADGESEGTMAGDVLSAVASVPGQLVLGAADSATMLYRSLPIIKGLASAARQKGDARFSLAAAGVETLLDTEVHPGLQAIASIATSGQSDGSLSDVVAGITTKAVEDLDEAIGGKEPNTILGSAIQGAARSTPGMIAALGISAVAGPMAGAVALTGSEVGSIVIDEFQSRTAEGVEEGQAATESLTVGALYAPTGIFLESFGLDKIMKGMPFWKAAKGRVRDYLSGVAKAGLAEGGTERLQGITSSSLGILIGDDQDEHAQILSEAGRQGKTGVLREFIHQFIGPEALTEFAAGALMGGGAASLTPQATAMQDAEAVEAPEEPTAPEPAESPVTAPEVSEGVDPSEAVREAYAGTPLADGGENAPMSAGRVPFTAIEARMEQVAPGMQGGRRGRVARLREAARGDIESGVASAPRQEASILAIASLGAELSEGTPKYEMVDAESLEVGNTFRLGDKIQGEVVAVEDDGARLIRYSEVQEGVDFGADEVIEDSAFTIATREAYPGQTVPVQVGSRGVELITAETQQSEFAGGNTIVEDGETTGADRAFVTDLINASRGQTGTAVEGRKFAFRDRARTDGERAVLAVAREHGSKVRFVDTDSTEFGGFFSRGGTIYLNTRYDNPDQMMRDFLYHETMHEVVNRSAQRAVTSNDPAEARQQYDEAKAAAVDELYNAFENIAPEAVASAREKVATTYAKLDPESPKFRDEVNARLAQDFGSVIDAVRHDPGEMARRAMALRVRGGPAFNSLLDYLASMLDRIGATELATRLRGFMDERRDSFRERKMARLRERTDDEVVRQSDEAALGIALYDALNTLSGRLANIESGGDPTLGGQAAFNEDGTRPTSGILEIPTDSRGIFDPEALMADPAFREWWGKSKVTDIRGLPLPIFHGTRDVFAIYDPGRRIKGNRSIFGTDTDVVAATYATDYTTPDPLPDVRQLPARADTWEQVVEFTTENSIAGFGVEHDGGSYEFQDQDGELIASFDNEADAVAYYNENPDKFTTGSVEEGGLWYDGNINAVFMSIQNPLIISADGSSWQNANNAITAMTKAMARGFDNLTPAEHDALDNDPFANFSDEAIEIYKARMADLSNAQSELAADPANDAAREALNSMLDPIDRSAADVNQVGPASESDIELFEQAASAHVYSESYADPSRGLTPIGADSLAQAAESLGHDGVIVQNVQDSNSEAQGISDVYIAFSPKQIKSANSNTGGFDPNQPDVRLAADPEGKAERRPYAEAVEQRVAARDILSDEAIEGRGRPDLTDPVLSEDAEKMTRTFDNLRNAANEPGYESLQSMADDAKRLMNQPGALDETRAKALSGQVLNPGETILMGEAYRAAAERAVTTHSSRDIRRAVVDHWAYREAGAANARALGARRWFNKGRRELRREQFSELLMAPGRSLQRQFDKVNKELADENRTAEEQTNLEAQLDNLIRQHQKEVEKTLRRLADAGFDLSKLSPTYLEDPRTLADMSRIAHNRGADFWDVLFELKLAAMLSGPHTHIVNDTSNALNMMFEFGVVNGLEAAINSGLSAVGLGSQDVATIKELKYMFRAAPVAMKQAAENFMFSMATERPAFATEIQFEQTGMFDVQTGSIPGRTGRIARFASTTLLQAEDEFFKTLGGTMAAHGLAYRYARREAERLGLNEQEESALRESMLADPLSDVWAKAYKQAQKLTFQQDNEFARLVNRGLSWIGNSVPEARFLMRGIEFALRVGYAPFIKTPLNIASRGLAFTPGVSHTKQIARAAATLVNPQGGASYVNDRAGFIRDTARTTISTAIGFMLMHLAGDDEDKWITRGSPINFRERKFAERLSPPPGSIRIPIPGEDVWINYERLDPMATTLGLTAAAVDAWRNPGEQARGIAVAEEMFAEVGRIITDRTFLRGMGSLIESFVNRNLETEARRFARTMTIGWVPNLLRQPNWATDTNRRQSVNIPREDGVLPIIADEFRYNALPGANRALPIAVDVWGREIENGPVGANFGSTMYRALSPYRPHVVEEYWPDTLIKNFNERVERGDFLEFPEEVRRYDPIEPWNTIRMRGQSIRLDPDEYNEYLRERGTLAREMMDKVRGRLDVENPGPREIELIRGVFSRASRAANRAAFRRREESDQ